MTSFVCLTLLLTTTVGVASTKSVTQKPCDGQMSCLADMQAAVHGSGVALLQTAADGSGSSGGSRKQELMERAALLHAQGGVQAPLKGRVVTLEAEVVSLTDRVSVLSASVGVSGAAPAEFAQKISLLGQPKQYQHYASLLKIGMADATSETSLKESVADLEGRCATLMSQVEGLENQVSGNGLTALIEMQAGISAQESSLTSRVVALEDTVVNIRSRVTSLEQTVSG